MKFYRLVFMEIKIGRNRYMVLFTSLAFFFVMWVLFVLKLQQYEYLGNAPYHTSGDILCFFFWGAVPQGTEIDITLIRRQMPWLCLLLGSAFVSIGYMTDTDLFEYQILSRSGNRFQWWFSKCMINIMSTLAYFMIGMAVILSFSVFTGTHFSNELTGSLMEFFLSLADEQVTFFPEELSAAMIFLPVVCCIAWNLLMLFMEIFISDVLCFLLSAMMLLLSLFLNSPLIIGNYMMFIRIEYFTPDGFRIIWGYVLAGVIVLISVCGGSFVIHKHDFLLGGDK